MNWDVYWIEGKVPKDIQNVCKNIKSWQKISYVPAMNHLSDKCNLSKNLLMMKKEFPVPYNFFPKTWDLPVDLTSFT